MEHKTQAGVIVIIENEHNRFLLEQRDFNSKLFKWSWVFPGGSQEQTESSLETAIREVAEEFGLVLSPDALTSIGTCSTHSGTKFNEIWYTKISGSPKLIISESAGAGWFTIDEIKQMGLGYGQDELVLPVVIDYCLLSETN